MGVDYVWSAEAWGQDAVTSLAYLAGQTSRIRLGTGIMQISARTPSMTAMTALALHDLSNGRFVLGLGTSGPQVVEGLQGVAFRAPLTRLQETVEIVRMAFRGETLRYAGQVHTLPRPGGEGKALRIEHPPAKIPIFLATLAPKALESKPLIKGLIASTFRPDACIWRINAAVMNVLPTSVPVPVTKMVVTGNRRQVPLHRSEPERCR